MKLGMRRKHERTGTTKSNCLMEFCPDRFNDERSVSGSDKKDKFMKSRYVVLLILVLPITIGAGGGSMGNPESELAKLLPNNLEGWKVAEQDRIYDRENLYEYIDGGAELYLSYRFHNVISRMYTAPGQPDILLDLFDMGNSQDAYGVFSHSRETEDRMFGQGSQYTAGLLLFWKDRYFVSILAYPETDESKKAVFNLARHVNAAIEAEGPLPEILNLLPQESLVTESIRYFHHHIWLNSYYFVAQENILHIDENTDVLLAKYGDRPNRYFLLIVKYPTEKEATIAYEDFVKNYVPELSETPVVRIEDGTWTGCQLMGEHLIIVFNAPTEENALHLIEEVQHNIAQIEHG